VTEAIQLVTYELDAFPHGLITLLRIQNITNSFFNLERVITTHNLGKLFTQIELGNKTQTKNIENQIFLFLDYSVNMKLLTNALLTKMDKDNDGSVSQSDFVYFILNSLRHFNISYSHRVDEYLKSYFDIYQSSVHGLLKKYGLKDISLCESALFRHLFCFFTVLNLI